MVYPKGTSHRRRHEFIIYMDKSETCEFRDVATNFVLISKLPQSSVVCIIRSGIKFAEFLSPWIEFLVHKHCGGFGGFVVIGK